MRKLIWKLVCITIFTAAGGTILFFAYKGLQMYRLEKVVAKRTDINNQQYEDQYVLIQLIGKKDFKLEDFEKLYDGEDVLKVTKISDGEIYYGTNFYDFSFDDKGRLHNVELRFLDGVIYPKNIEDKYVLLLDSIKYQQQDIDIFIQLVRMKYYSLEDFELLEYGILCEDSYVINGYIFRFDIVGKLIEVTPREDATK